MKSTLQRIQVPPEAVLRSSPQSSRGFALPVALLILFVVTLVVLTGVRTSNLELHMARNEEAKNTAFQTASAFIDDTAGEAGNFAVTGLPGSMNCTTGTKKPDNSACESYTVQTSGTWPTSTTANVRIRVERMAPDLAPTPRMTNGSSLTAFKAANFRIDSTFDETAAKGGRSRQMNGYIVLVPTGPGS